MVVNNYFGFLLFDDAVNRFHGYGVAVDEGYRQHVCNCGGCGDDIQDGQRFTCLQA